MEPATIAIESAKVVAKAAFDAFAKHAYQVNCKNQQKKDLLCAALSGWGAQEEWQESVTHQLTDIQANVTRINRGLEEIRSSIEDLLALTRLTHIKLDELFTGTKVLEHLIEFKVYYNDTFTKLFPKVGPGPLDVEKLKEAINGDGLMGFAGEALGRLDFRAKLGYIHAALVERPIAGKDALLDLYAREYAAQMRITSIGPRKAYELYENTVADLLYQQARAHLMSVYAAAVLKAKREASGAAPDAKEADPKKLWEDWEAKRAQQLAAFNHNVEALVLELSPNVHGRAADFLHPAARELFALADRFTSAMLGEYGLRGRIISMGDAFTGTIQLGGKAVEPTNPGGTTIPAGKLLDWWTRSKGQGTAYDVVHFASNWKVFRYAMKADAAGKHAITASLPYSPATPEVFGFNKDDFTPAAPGANTVWFGSFAEVERSGGGFALLGGAWSEEKPIRYTEGGARYISERRRNDITKADLFRLVTDDMGRLEYVPFHGEPQGVNFHDVLRLVKKDTIRLQGQHPRLRLHVDFDDAYRVVNTNEVRVDSEAPRGAFIKIYARYKSVNDRWPHSKVRGYIRIHAAEIGPSNWANPPAPIIELKSESEYSKFNFNQEYTLEKIDADGDVNIGDAGLKLTLVAGAEGTLYTTGWDASHWDYKVYVQIRNAYFVATEA